MAQIVVRSDHETDRALAHLVELTGRAKSELVRDAIKAAERDAVLSRVQRQAEELRTDPEDLAEVRAIRAEMDSIGAW